MEGKSKAETTKARGGARVFREKEGLGKLS